MRWVVGVVVFWKVGVDDLTMHTHFRTCTISYLFEC